MADEDEYACVNKAKLRIKNDSGVSKKKKKKSNKETEKLVETEIKQQVNQDKRTKAEIAFQKMQEKNVSPIIILIISFKLNFSPYLYLHARC